MEINSPLRRERTPDITLGANGPIGTAATTVNIVSHVGIAASVAGLTFTLPVPTDARAGLDFRVTNAGTNTFTIGSKLLGVNDYADFSFDGGVWHTEAPSTGAHCPAPMTRIALITLRNASQLNPECHYTITDHVQNRLVAGTTITLHAVAVNELSERVEVNTTYDNEAWTGVYDLDRALVLELTDNRGNVARGPNGTEVSNFDWGNIAYTNNVVDFSTLVVTYGATAQVVNNRIERSSTVNLTGFTGAFNNNHIHTAANVNFTGANGTWRYNEWKNGGSFTASGYVGGGDSYYNEFDITTVNLTGVTGLITLRVNEYVGGALTVQGAAAFTMQNSNCIGMSINRATTGGVFSANYLSCREGGTISHTGAGALNTTGAQVNGVLQLSGPGALTFNYGSCDQSCSVHNQGLGPLSATRTTLTGASTYILVDSGSNKTVTINDTNMYSSSVIRLLGALAGGVFTVTNSRMEANSTIYHRTVGALNITQTSMSGGCLIDARSGDRNYSITRLSMSAVAQFVGTGTGVGITDSFGDIHLFSRGNVNDSATGPANSLLYSSISGLSGSFNFTGTTGNQACNRIKCHDGSISINSCTANLNMALCEAHDAGVITCQNIVTARSISYLSVESQGAITINNSSVAGATDRVSCRTGGVYVLSGAAVNATGVDVQRGTLSHNGGSLNSIVKAGSSVLTTGNFNHTNCVFMRAASLTCTAANTDRFTPPAAGAML